MIKPVDAKPGTGMTYDAPLSPAPAPTSPSESVAAPAEVGQVMGTLSLEQFKGWLETKAHAASQKVSGSSLHYPTPEELGSALVHAECRAAIKLLMAFKLEQGA